MGFSIQSTAFEEGGVIPQKYSCDGGDASPPLSWGGEPAGTKSFVLIVDDPDAPVGTWNHWLLCDIPAPYHSLAERFEPGREGVSGKNDFGNRGYGGPCPPKGHGSHRYFFKLFALDVPSVGLPDGASRKAIDNAIDGHVLGKAQCMGTYERKP